MILRRHYAVEAVTETQAAFFKDAQVGDRLRVSIQLKENNQSAMYVKVENLTQGTSRDDYMGRIYNGLATLQLRELD